MAQHDLDRVGVGQAQYLTTDVDVDFVRTPGSGEQIVMLDSRRIHVLHLAGK